MEQINRAIEALEDPEVRRKFERESLQGLHADLIDAQDKTKKKKLDPARALEIAQNRKSQRESWVR